VARSPWWVVEVCGDGVSGEGGWGLSLVCLSDIAASAQTPNNNQQPTTNNQQPGHERPQTFNFCDPVTALATQEIAGEWAGSGAIEVPSQENDPSCAGAACDIGRICTMLLDPPSSKKASSSSLAHKSRSLFAAGGGAAARSSADPVVDDNVLSLALVSSAQNGGRCLQGWTEAAVADAQQKALLDTASSARSWPYQVDEGKIGRGATFADLSLMIH